MHQSSKIREGLKTVLGTVGLLDFARWAVRKMGLVRDKSPLEYYFDGGRVPFSYGYLEYRMQVILNTLNDPDLMARFRQGTPLPDGYGYAVSERCVEYPWMFSQLPQDAARVLDAGSTLNHEGLVNYLTKYFDLSKSHLHIMTLAPEKEAFYQHGISYIYEDLRDIPLRDEYYDVIVCLSTLEHVGFDNFNYSDDPTFRENNPDDYLKVMAEFRRVLKPGGTLLLSVPYGKAVRDYETFQLFNEQTLEKAVAAFGRAQVARTFFKYAAAGWQFSEQADCNNAVPVDWIMRPQSRFDEPFPVQPDGAASSRAIACVKFQKLASDPT